VAVILAIGGVVLALFLQVILAGLLLFVALLALASLVGNLESMVEMSRRRRWQVQAAIIILGAGLEVYFLYPLWREEMAQRLTGELASSEAMADVPDGSYCMKIGTGSKLCTQKPVAYLVGVLGDRLVLREVDGKASLSTVVRDASGNLLVEIVDNKWRVAKETTEVWDKNYNANKLEVLDGKGLVALTVELFTNGVRIEGDWRDEYGEDVRIWQADDKTGHIDTFKRGEVIPRNEIRKRFQYPSKEHWGELVIRPHPPPLP